MSPDESIDLHLRPWIGDLPPIPPSPPGGAVTADRVRGMLLGLAIGDALGNTSEGMLPDRRRREHGEIRDYLPNPHAGGEAVGLPSDDTQMAFWTVESLLTRGRLDPADLADAFSSRQIFGKGRTIRAFLRAHRDEGLPWCQSGQESAGNGALMRIAPVVLPHLGSPGPDLWRDTIAATVLTHRDEAAVAASVGFVGVLVECLSFPEPVLPRGPVAPPPAWWPQTFVRYARLMEQRRSEYVLRTSSSDFHKGTLCDLVEREVPRALERRTDVLAFADHWFSGAFLLETLPCVLFILGRHGADPEEAILRAVNDTRDNDTIAAAVGAAAGALHGESALPLRWREGLLGRLGSEDDGRVQALVEQAVAAFVPPASTPPSLGI